MNLIKIEKIESIELLDNCAELLTQSYNTEPWNDNWSQKKALEKLACFYNSPKFLGWVAYEGDEMLGACVGNIEPYYIGDYFYLKELFVFPEYQRKGVGSKLVKTMKEYLDSIGIETVILFTSNESFPFEFYKKQGFGEMEGMRMMSFGKTE